MLDCRQVGVHAACNAALYVSYAQCAALLGKWQAVERGLEWAQSCDTDAGDTVDELLRHQLND